MEYSDREKQAIFVKRTQEKYSGVWRKYLELVEHTNWSPERLHDYNFKRRQELVKFAYANTPFYKKLYDDAGVGPEGIRSEEDWDKLPIVTKDMLRTRFDDFIVGGSNGEVLSRFGDAQHTGGSTGVPLKVYRDKRFPYDVLDWRMRSFFAGYFPGMVVGDERAIPIIGVNEGWVWRTEDWKICSDIKFREEKKALWYPMKKFFLEARTMNGLDSFLDSMGEDGISYLTGYAGAVYEMAKYILDKGLVFARYPFAVSTCATPLNPTMRKAIQQAFQCEVGNIYGTNEFCWIASSYKGDDDSLYVFTDMNHIDIVDEDEHVISGHEEGRVCVSAFENHVMPLVKYCLNDRACWRDYQGSQDGGRMPFPRLSTLMGRESDYLLDKKGVKVFGFCTTFDNYPDCVIAYRFVQRSQGVVKVLIVPNRRYSAWEKDLEVAIGKWRHLLGERMLFLIEEVDTLPHDGGKVRFIIHE